MNLFPRGDQKLYGPSNLVGYKVDSQKEECISMTMSGLKLIDRIRNKQIVTAQRILKQNL